MRFDMDLCIHQYAVHFVVPPVLGSCLFGDSKSPFLQWMQKSTNELLVGDGLDLLEYPTRVMFRHPTALCAISNIVFCAESVKLTIDTDDHSQDDDEYAYV